MYLLTSLQFKIMDQIELYINGFRFANTTAKRDHSIVFNGKKFKSAAGLFESLVDILEPDLDNQIETLRKKLAKHQYFYFCEYDY